MTHRIVTVLLTLVAATPVIFGATPILAAADVAQGERIARRWCAACHVVSADQNRASADVPSFFDVARRKSGEDLKAFLTDPHPRMPDMSLTRAEIADLVAYIESMKK